MKTTIDVIPHLEDLWRYGRVLTGNDSDADDLVQEALARALSMAGGYDTSRPLLPWLIRIVRNTFLTGASQANADRRRLASIADMSDTAWPPSQEHCAELSKVGRALARMPADQAEILHLVGVLGFTYSEAAELLGVPPGTVMSRLSRARAALKHNMENLDDGASPHLKVVGGRYVAR
ncbi:MULTISPECIES: sigma-70 family RNA polymerase sigma factor [unclassified Mesorhizobium]|uniref:sigma-70 family RNA polymerase sigma factor n=1 Tax=unclassified Mesorhizobium TaxID=325217 RepID=UPI00112DAA7D|nr:MULTISPECIES: sigma-70 family RNA polymerase sigma factor [unclassified Mesorhizobium]TPJ46070.1 sigma-70 family RNA polymerase sigma factor [Mesorhizobium sp. B2-6-6]MBZ9982371.1 sigma-70 family RNA polymerase sigma factor [Mesorhizobium sp. BR-1-1-8]MCA0008570.1 sigma-70 family RNA polymerase sigma factor [Mesorhizobium sp. B264B1B]MCA0018832.1 sigma-70 family RNA polymerase sigma factor [Mesorhizobium sp. B264B1A]MCA0025789.1 sigma-70 family RNA polymerase sigma factor [Mesorhizobium sp.